MADWSLLPKELLEEIATRLNSQFYILRFRSVCSTWRSSIPHRPRRFPFLTNHGISDSTLAFRLSKRSLFLLSPPSSPHLSWLVKIELDPSHRRAHLLNPLSRSATSSSPLPESFPEFLDLTHFRVYDFGDEYVLHDVNIRHVANNAANLYMEKVAVMCSNDDYVLLTIHVSGKLAIFRSSEKRWVVVNEMPSPYDDVMLFKGEFYAVDGMGRTVRVDLETRSTSLVAEAVYGGDKKFLVESGGEVMVVDMYLSTHQEVDWEEAEEVSQAQLVGCMYERTVSFKVYRVDEAEKRLVRVRNLGDRVLFLGDDCTFSASAGELGCGVRGNCIYFTDNFFYTSGEEVGIFKGRDIGVFDLEGGVITPLSDCPEAAKLFWPPPEWVLRTASQQVQTEFERLAL